MGSFIEDYAVLIQLLGVLIVFAGWLWILIRAFRHRIGWGVAVLLFFPLGIMFALRHWRKGRAPLGLLLLGCVLLAVPPVAMRLIPVDLGPHERMVGGERHLTLTGWDRKDYAVLGSKRDTVVLQMANSDVTDETLGNLKGMDQLKELDLNRTQVTDAGLATLKDLPALATLRLSHTKITDAGFRSALMDKESLNQLELQGTGVSRETVQAWKAARPRRRALQ